MGTKGEIMQTQCMVEKAASVTHQLMSRVSLCTEAPFEQKHQDIPYLLDKIPPNYDNIARTFSNITFFFVSLHRV